MKRTIAFASLALALVGSLAVAAVGQSADFATTLSTDSTGAVFSPAVAEWQFISASTTPPTEAQCYSAGR